MKKSEGTDYNTRIYEYKELSTGTQVFMRTDPVKRLLHSLISDKFYKNKKNISSYLSTASRKTVHWPT